METQETQSIDQDLAPEDLPFSELKSRLKKEGIEFKRTDKKPALVAMYKAKKTLHKPDVRGGKHSLEDISVPKPKAYLSDNLLAQLEPLKNRGLTWNVNEEDCCIVFSRDLKITCTLDTDERNIIRSARAAFAGAAPVEKGNE